MANGIVGRSQGYVADQTELLQIVVDGLAVYNQTADPIISDLSQEITQENMRVPQAPIQFNRHADGSSPEAQRQSYRLLTTPLQDWDAGTPWTVIGLQDALASDVQSTMDGVMAGDAERMEAEFFRALFTKKTSGSVGTAYQSGFYQGETDVPDYKNNTFMGTAHNHYKGLNTTTLALSHLQEAARNIREHGYGLRKNSLVSFWHSDQQDDIENLLNITVASSLNSPERAKAQDLGGYGTGIMYAGIEIVFNDNVPTGYFCVVDRTVKPVAKRVHVQEQYRGLQMFTSTFNEKFPLAGQNFLNRFGFAIRQLGAGVAYQLVGSATYTNPTFRLTN